MGKARDERLTQKLIDYLNGDNSIFESKGQRDPQYLYKLHKALGNYEQAAHTATIIAKNEQDKGNYKVVHDLLYLTIGKNNFIWS